MIKNGKYAIYLGKEYELSEDSDGNLVVLTEDASLIDDSFDDVYDSGVFTKRIQLEDLEEIVSIKTYGVVNGIKVYIRKEYRDSFLVGTSNRSDADVLKMERTDKYGYEAVIKKEDIELREDRIVLKEKR